MNDTICRATGLGIVEARNAIRAEGFRALPEDIALWRFREVLTKLGAALGLSGGAVVYALDLTGLLTEADWRGDGRPVTFHSVRSYARKVGKSERTICEYERQLIAAGLVHRTLKHARRHGGQGDERRRSGLDWRSFGARMPELLDRLAARRAEEERRLDIEARIRSERRIVTGLVEGMEEGRARAVLAQLKAMRVLRLSGTPTVEDLTARLGALVLLRAALADDVDNPGIAPRGADRSEDIAGRIDDTEDLPCPSDIRSGQEAGKRPERRKAEKEERGIDTIPLEEIWRAAPDSWKDALGPGIAVTWPVLIELAGRIAPRLDVSPGAWWNALRTLGPSQAALALMVLDRNRRHPTRPVGSVGGALVGMTRRAGEGAFNLAPSVHGVLARTRRTGDNPLAGGPRPV